MMDDFGTHKVKQEDLKKPQNVQSKEGFSKDEIDSIADLISEDPPSDPNVDPDDTGRFTL